MKTRYNLFRAVLRAVFCLMLLRPCAARCEHEGQPDPNMPGNGLFGSPYLLGTLRHGSFFTHTADMQVMQNKIGAKANECYYAFTLDHPMLVVANTVPTQTYTTIYLYSKPEFDYIYSTYSWDETSTPATTREMWSPYEAMLRSDVDAIEQQQFSPWFCRILPAGSYFLMPEGISGNATNNGITTTHIYAFETPGSSEEHPLDWGEYDSDFDFSKLIFKEEVISPPDRPDDMEVYGTFRLLVPMRISITFGALIPTDADGRFEVYIRNESSEEVVPVLPGPHPYSFYVETELQPGAYIIELQASKAAAMDFACQGQRLPTPGDDFTHPIDLGTLAPGRRYSDTQDTRSFTNCDRTYPLNDVIYRFRIDAVSDVTVTHRGTQLDRGTSILLRDAERNLVDGPGVAIMWDDQLIMTCIYSSLPPGVYYAVSEGYSLNGTIRTQIWAEPRTDTIPEPDFLPSDGMNYVMTITPRRETSAMTQQIPVGDAVHSIGYYDGLGRPVRQVARGASPRKEDIVTATEYNASGEKSIEWQPVALPSTGGCPELKQLRDAGCRLYEDSRPFSETLYEPDMLFRIREQRLSGDEWFRAQRSRRFRTLLNTQSGELSCRRFAVDAAGTLTDLGFYAADSLTVSAVTDEDNTVEYTFTDKAGRQILVRRVGPDGERFDTYSVYAPEGDLCCVLPPELSAREQIGEADLDLYAFRYVYDGFHRMIRRKLPGKDREEFVYDPYDRPVLRQDGEQRKAGEWSLTVYDAQGRAALTGIYTGPRPEFVGNLVAEPDSTAESGYRIAGELDASRIVVRQATFYDTYAALPRSMRCEELRYRAAEGFGTRCGTDDDPIRYKGLPVGNILYDLDTGEPYCSVLYYDYDNRVVQQRMLGPGGRLQIVDSRYDFAGEPLRQREVVRLAAGMDADTLDTRRVYDHAGRLLASRTTLNGSASAVTEYAYDAIGRLTQTVQGEDSAALWTTRAYNVRNALTRQQNDLFSMSLAYASPREGIAPCYSGGISEWTWRHGDGERERTYAFSYDALSRLSDSRLLTDGAADDSFVERGLTYDRNGNVLTMERTCGSEPPTSLAYTYAGNRLAALDEGGQRYLYDYDANGNMIRDGRRGLDLTYNRLNLAKKVMRAGSTVANYSYLSDGTRLSAVNGSGDGLYYAGSLVYRKRDGVLSLESAGFAGGRFAVTTSGVETRYHVSDHLGSVRAVVSSGGEVLERSDYYPFGLRWGDATQPLSDNRYRYNGKEEQGFVDNPYLRYEARLYDAHTGRWTAADPMMQFPSPYQFCANNPVNLIDPNGMWTGHPGQYTTQDEYEIADFMTAAKNGFYGENPIDYILRTIALDEYIKQNIGVYTEESDGTYSTAIGVTLIMSRKLGGSWKPENMDDVRAWQADFAQNLDFYATMSNPIVQAIHRGQREFLATALDFGGDVLSKTGNTIAMGGYVFSWAGGSGLALASVGESLNSIGTMMSFSANLIQGDMRKATYKMASHFIIKGFGLLSSVARLNEVNQGIYNMILQPYSWVISYESTLVEN